MEQHQSRATECKRRSGYGRTNHQPPIDDAAHGVRRAHLFLGCTLCAALLIGPPAASGRQEAEFSRHARLAQAAIKTNDNVTAESELNAMLQADPGNVDAHANLGMLKF